MQNELQVLRPKLGMKHPADRLYVFDYQWQDVVATSNNPMMCLLEWNEYKERYELAAKSWKKYDLFFDYLTVVTAYPALTSTSKVIVQYAAS